MKGLLRYMYSYCIGSSVLNGLVVSKACSQCRYIGRVSQDLDAKLNVC